MACCAIRCILISICIIQMVSTIQRQILDFLGFMWPPFIVNFIHIIIIILGIFGAYQYKIKYITSYVVWNCLWLVWNVFVICVYMEAGLLTRDTEVLNLGTGSRSWWLANGLGCVPFYNSTLEESDPLATPSSVEGCVLEYFYVEAAQALLQCLLAVVGVAAGCGTIYVILREDDSCSRKQIHRLPYSLQYQNNSTLPDQSGMQRPMTPRKVKQRSTRSKRSSRKRYYQNPVTKLLNSAPSSESTVINYYPGQVNPVYTLSETGPEGPRPSSILFLNGRPSPIYMNEMDTVI